MLKCRGRAEFRAVPAGPGPARVRLSDATSGSSGCWTTRGCPWRRESQTLDKKRLPPRVVQQARTLLEGSFLDRHENVLVFGQPGSGKTHLLSALGQEL